MWSSAFVATFLLASALAGEQWQQLVVKWNPQPDSGSFFVLPASLDEAIGSGWITQSEYDEFPVYCMQGDYRVCTVYNQNGALVALDMSLSVSDVDNGCTTYKWSNLAYKKQTRWYTDIYTTRIWFSNPATASSAPMSLTGNFGDGMWIGLGNTYKNIAVTNETYPQNNYKWQNCIPTMGRHYYYNMSSSLDCDYFDPIFLITNDQTGKLIGFGWQNFGNYTVQTRNWFESISPNAIRATIPQTPTCLTDWVQKCGIVSAHVYMISEPWKQKCGPTA